MNEEPKIPEIKQPVVPIKPAVKAAAKQPELKASEVTEIPKPSFKPGDPGVTVRSGFTEVPPNLPFAMAIIASAKPEWLPTLMAKIGQRCINEKVFANPRAMALAIEGAVRVK